MMTFTQFNDAFYPNDSHHDSDYWERRERYELYRFGFFRHCRVSRWHRILNSRFTANEKVARIMRERRSPNYIPF